jgi:hypothetical protein
MGSARRNARELTYADINANSIAHRIVHHAQNLARLSVATPIVQSCAKRGACCALKNVKISAHIQSAPKSVLIHATGNLAIYLAKNS